MKNIHKKIIGLIICCALCIFAFAGCDVFTKYSLTLSTNDTEICSLYGGGQYYADKQISIVCEKKGDKNKNFLGWYEDETLVSKDMSFTYTTKNKDVTLVAKWSNEITHLNLYSNKYNNYSNLSSCFYKTIEREQEKSLEVLPPFTDGVVFCGWYKNSALTDMVSESANIGQVNLNDQTNLFAKWETGYYTLNFVCANPVSYSIQPNKTNFSYGEQITIEVPKTYENLNFIGFYINSVLASNNNIYTFNMPLKNIEIEAKYSTPSEFNYTQDSDNKLTLTSYNGTDSELYIPNIIDGKEVLSFTADCFKNVNLTKLFIPQTILSIPDGAFYGVQTDLYFDYGFDISLINSNVLKAENNVYVNVKYHDTNNSLIDSFYCIYEGRIADDEIDSKQEFLDFYNYLWLYGIDGKIDIEFKNYIPLEDSSLSRQQRLLNGMTALINEENKKMSYKSTLNNSFKYSANVLGTKYYGSFEFTKKSYSIATETNATLQTQIDCAISYTTNTPSQRELMIDTSKKYMTVNNTEQLLMAVSSGYVPITKDQVTKDVLAKGESILSQIITETMTDIEKVTAIHDYIIMNNIYDTELLNKSTSNATNLDKYKGFYLEGTLLDGVSVCDGIAKTFQFLCNLENITAIKVIGTLNGGGHAWNKVKIADEWYAVDATNDNKIINSTTESLEFLSHELFLVSDSELQEFGHVESSNITYPKANNSLRLNYYLNTKYGSDYNLVLNSQAEANALASFVKSKKQSSSRISIEFIIYNSDASKISLNSILCFGKNPYLKKSIYSNAMLYIMLI